MKRLFQLTVMLILLMCPMRGRADGTNPPVKSMSPNSQRPARGIKSAPNGTPGGKTPLKLKTRPLDIRNQTYRVEERRAAERKGLHAGSRALGMTLAGYCAYAENYDYIRTFDDISAEGVEIKWEDTYSYEEDFTVKGGFVRDGVLYQLTEKWDFNPATFELAQVITLYGLDYDSGEILSSEIIPEESAPVYDIIAYDEAGDYIYGYGLLPGHEGTVFMRTPFENLSAPEFISSVPDGQPTLYALCWNASDGLMYGINEEKEFVSIDSRGKQTVLFNIEMDYGSTYYGAMIYSVADRCFYWNINYFDGSALACIDAAIGSAEVLFPFADGNQFVYFATTDSSDPEAPAKPSLVASGFANGSTSGDIVFRAPDSLVNGDRIPTDKPLGYLLKMDGAEYQSGEVLAGAELKIGLSDLEEGIHTFAFSVSCNGIASAPLRMKSYIGFDTPMAPADVRLSTDRVTWTKVDTSVHGGYVDFTNLEYKVYVNGEFYGATANDALPIALPSDKELTLYTAQVSCSVDGKESEMASSNMLAYGTPFSVPYFVKPTVEQAILSYVWDSNFDDVSWTLIEDGPFYISYSQTDQPHDDWVILPPVALTDTGSYYSLSFETSMISDAYPLEFIEVLLGEGPSPKEMKYKLVEKYQPSKCYPEADVVNALIKIDHPGTYYLGFHAVSAPDQAGLTFGNVSVTDNNIRDNSPQAPEVTGCVPGEKGRLEAHVTVKAPTLTMGGAKLPQDEIMEISLASGNASCKVTAKPGEEMELTVETAQGDNLLTLRTSLGALNAPDIQIPVYTGIVPPKTPVQVSTVTHPDNTSMTLTWGKVTEGENNGYLIPENIVYDVYRAINWGYYIQYDSLAEGLTATTYTYTLPDTDAGTFIPQENVTLAVAARNEAGTNGRMAAFWDVLGTPYTVPFIEDLEGWNFESFGWYMYAPNASATAEWVIDLIDTVNPEWGDPYHGILLCQGERGSIGMLGMPRITTEGIPHASLNITMYAGKDAPDVRILAASCDNSSPREIGFFQAGDKDGLSVVEFPIPDELMGKGWIQIYIQPEFSSSSQLFAATAFAVNKTSGIGLVSENAPVVVKNDGVEVTVASGESIAVFDIQGRKIYEAVGNGSRMAVSLDKGIYVVKTSSKASKVLIK